MTSLGVCSLMGGARFETERAKALREENLQRGLATLVGTDANGVEDRQHEDLAVTDSARGWDLADRRDDLLGPCGRDDDLDLDLRHEVDDVGRAAIELGLATGPTEALDLADRHATDVERGQSLLDVVELEGADQGLDLDEAAVVGIVD